MEPLPRPKFQVLPYGFGILSAALLFGAWYLIEHNSDFRLSSRLSFGDRNEPVPWWPPTFGFAGMVIVTMIAALKHRAIVRNGRYVRARTISAVPRDSEIVNLEVAYEFEGANLQGRLALSKVSENTRVGAEFWIIVDERHPDRIHYNTSCKNPGS